MAQRKPGKYASVVPGLPELPVDGTWQGKLDAFKQSFIESFKGRQPTAPELAKAYAALRREEQELKLASSTNYLAQEAITQMMVESQNRGEEGWGQYGAAPNTMVLASGDRLRIDIEPYAQVVDKDANRLWAVKEGLERLLSLPWATINKLAKERLLAGQPEPPGVKTFKKRTVVFTAFKAADGQGVTLEEEAPEWSPDDPATGADQPF